MKALVTLLVVGLSINVWAQPKSTSKSLLTDKSESAQGDNSMVVLQPRASRFLVLAQGNYDTYTLRSKTNRDGNISESESKNDEKTFGIGLKYGLSDSIAFAFSIDTGKAEYTSSSNGNTNYQSENSGLSSPSVWAEHKGEIASSTSLFSRAGAIVPIGDHKCKISETRRTSSGGSIQECDRQQGGWVGLLKTGIENRGSMYTGLSVEARLMDRQTEKYTSSNGREIEYHTTGGNQYIATAYIENPGTTFKVGGGLMYEHWAPSNWTSNQGSNSAGTYVDFAKAGIYTDMKMTKGFSLFPKLSYTRLLRTSINDTNYEGQSWVTATVTAVIGI